MSDRPTMCGGPPLRSSLVLLAGLLALGLGVVGPAAGATRFVATTGSDTGNTCLASSNPCKTMTRAISQAVAGDTIIVAPGTYNPTLGETFPIVFTKSLTLNGAGAGSTVIDAGTTNTGMGIWGSPGAPAVVTISGVTVQNASAPGIDISLDNTATLVNVVVTGNTGTGSDVAEGGGIDNSGDLTLQNVTISGNSVTATGSGSEARGAGIMNVVNAGGNGNRGRLTLTNVTISGNTASSTGSGGRAWGAGIFIFRNGNAATTPSIYTNVTIAGNVATAPGSAQGGGIYNFGPGILSLQNSIVANNTGGNCGGGLTSLGHNLDSGSTCGFAGPGDLNNTDPLLGPLQDNGGPTRTQALLPGSPAIDAGDNAGCPAVDQRGYVRPVDGDGHGGATCDIGAFEVVPVGGAAVVAAVLPSSRSVQVGSAATVFAAIINAGPGPATGCRPAPVTPLPATFGYQTTNPATNALTGTPNTPVDIEAGKLQTFVFAFTPASPFGPTDVQLTFGCTNTAPAPSTRGLNTLLFSASATPVPDLVALAATATNDGILSLTSVGAFAVATVNVGAGGAITVSADTGSASLPLSLTVCQTDPGTGACLAPPTPTVPTQINAGTTPTFGIFASATGSVAFDPATNRIYVRFTDGGGVVRGATSVAVRTQ